MGAMAYQVCRLKKDDGKLHGIELFIIGPYLISFECSMSLIEPLTGSYFYGVATL
jgi:hypothetical protein